MKEIETSKGTFIFIDGEIKSNYQFLANCKNIEPLGLVKDITEEIAQTIVDKSTVVERYYEYCRPGMKTPPYGSGVIYPFATAKESLQSLIKSNFPKSINNDLMYIVKISKPWTHKVIKAAMDAVAKDVQKPKVVRDGKVVAEPQQLKVIITNFCERCRHGSIMTSSHPCRKECQDSSSNEMILQSLIPKPYIDTPEHKARIESGRYLVVRRDGKKEIETFDNGWTYNRTVNTIIAYYLPKID